MKPPDPLPIDLADPQAAPGQDPALRELIPRPLDWRVITLLTLAAIVLTGSNYFGHYSKIDKTLAAAAKYCGLERAEQVLADFFGGRGSQGRQHLHQLQYWAAAHTLLYFVLPALVIKYVLRERLRDYGLKLTGWSRRLWIYVAAFAVVLPLVVLFGRTASFQNTYPFYRDAGKSWVDFLAWEASYAVQFFALEFFFRGVMVMGLKDRFGFYAVFIMTVPYCMIHFGKPLPETIGAIIAGVFLGTLSLWTRSIWLGFLIHVSVAMSMDLTALAYRGGLRGLLGG